MQRTRENPQGYRLFLREFLRNFHTTGAVLPSGDKLAAALTRDVRLFSDKPRAILEVGPGTGSVTAHIVRSMREGDTLDIVEINESFVEKIRERFSREDAFRAVSDRTKILHADIASLPRDKQYDLIISGLPLNNFSAQTVEQILGVLTGLMSPGATLSYFEYAWIRRIKERICRKAERERLRGIGVILKKLSEQHEMSRNFVPWNVLPAWAHHITKKL